METFRDANGKEWRVSVNFETIDRAREATGIDILEAGMSADHEDPRESVEFRLVAEPVLLCRVLWHFLTPEPTPADKQAYAEGMSGDALANARAALWSDLVNFTPDPEQRKLRRTILDKVTAWLEAGWTKARTMVEDPRIDRLLESEQQKLDAKFSGLLERLGSDSDD
jgi:hypothetical protein